MSIPSYGDIVHPLLKYLADTKKETGLATIREEIARKFNVTEEEKEERLRSGEKRFDNRVRWVAHDLRSAGLLKSPQRGHFLITQDGEKELEKKTELTREYLKQRYQEILSSKAQDTSSKSPQAEETDMEVSIQNDEHIPEEEIENALERIDNNVAEEILDYIRETSPGRFEEIAVKLLVKMRYGKEGKRTGGKGDGGIDGVVYEDELGFRQIGIQAKRYAEGKSVGPEDMRAFYGALGGKGFQKGVFVTTSSFTPAALQMVREMQEVNKRIITIDGEQMSKLMVKYGVGCERKVLVKSRVDKNFWQRDEK